MTRLYKCYGEDCVAINRKWEIKDLLKIKGKNYCRSCYKKKTIQKQGMAEINAKIRKFFGIKFPTPMMNNQIKKYLKEGATYDELSACFDYQYARKGSSSFVLKYGVAFIPYVLPRVQERMKLNEKNMNNLTTHYNIVHVSINDVSDLDTDLENEYKNSKKIDMKDKRLMIDG